MKMTSQSLINLLAVYKQLVACDNPKSVWRNEKQRFAQWPKSLFDSIFKPNDDDDQFLTFASDHAIQIGELLIIDLASDDNYNIRSVKYLRDTLNLLANVKDERKQLIVQGALVAMMVGLESFPASFTQEIIECLSDILDVDLGVIPKYRGILFRERNLNCPYGKIFKGALYAHVVRFLEMRKSLILEDTHKQIIKNIKCPVISVGSRKGGTGKSLFLIAALLWIKKKHREIHNDSPNCCVLDLDLSGPIWQYMLFPKRNEPTHFLDDYIHLDQDPRNFQFPPITKTQVMAAIEMSECPFGTPGKVAHVGVHDIPGINRTLSLASELNRPGFYKLLVETIAILSAEFDYVLIDNSPGFDGISYAALGLASSVDKGVAFVLSTPAFSDLAGTFLELADFRLARIARPPVWVINKSTEFSRKFTESKYTALEIAQKLQAYDDILPDTPLIKKILNPSRPAEIWKHARFDSQVTDFMFVDGEGQPKKINIQSTDFSCDVGAILEPIFAEWTTI